MYRIAGIFVATKNEPHAGRNILHAVQTLFYGKKQSGKPLFIAGYPFLDIFLVCPVERGAFFPVDFRIGFLQILCCF